MKRKRILFIGMAVILFVVIAAGIVVSGNGNKEINEHLSLGDKYLEDLEYEQALVEYGIVLDIDPDNSAALTGIENVCMEYAGNALLDTEKVSIENLESLLIVLEENYQLTRLDSIQGKSNEIKKIITEKEQHQKEYEKYLEEQQEIEGYEGWQEGLDKEVQEAEKIYSIISEWAFSEEVYKMLWNWYNWSNIKMVTINKVEGGDNYEVEVQGGPSLTEYYVYEIDKNTLQGRLTKYFAEDFNGNYLDETIYTDSPVIDLKKYSGQMEETERMGGQYQINIYNADTKVVRSKYAYLNWRYSKWEWEELNENGEILSEFKYCWFEETEGWNLCERKYTKEGECKILHQIHYDLDMNLIEENGYGW